VTPDEFRDRMQELVDLTGPGGDIDGVHKLADCLLCEVLTELGYGDGVEIFENMVKWYA
jgi:hypothetical protein